MKKRVLIVDNEVDAVSQSRYLALNREVTLDIAQTVEEAITLQGLRDYDFVIVGLQLTNSLGEKEFEILRSIKENKATTGVVLLTSSGDMQAAEDAIFIGASYYFEKRVSAKTIRDVLKKHCEC